MKSQLMIAKLKTRSPHISRLGLALVAGALAAGLALMAAQAPAAPDAQDQYQLAQKLEAAIEEKPGGLRTVADYTQVIDAYGKVQQVALTPQFITPSLIATGRLYEEMGHLFDTGYFQKAVDTYQLLLRSYPRSRLAPDALYSVAELEGGPLSHPALARKSLESLMALYPSSDQADQARLALAEHTLPSETGTSTPPADTAPPPAESAGAAPAEEETATPASSGSSPGGNGDVEGGEEGARPTLARAITSEERRGITRIVVQLSGPVKFQSAQITHPERVFFDLARAYLAHPHGVTLHPDTPFVNSVEMAQNEPHVVRVVLDVQSGAAYTASLLRNPYRLVIEIGRTATISARSRNFALASGEDTSASESASAGAVELATKGGLTPAQPMPNGATSMTRTLGLKIDRIVIDPGHGGFDTGSIGPTGLEEKTVCLQIAKQLGRLIGERLPGTRVVYTRDSDTFVPLEERTAIANEKKADLFISIHANSSTDPAARGVEVYYLNFTTSPEALAVAARENALAQEPVHKLQDLLKQISLNDKIEESQDFAMDVDHSLVDQLRLAHVETADRGVKKAPFVVLIGAHMPSILVEVSFLSNPQDEELLREASYRQSISSGIFDGIKRYLTGLNSLTFKEATASPTAGPH